MNSRHACRSAALLTYGFVAACALGVCLAGALHYEVGTGVNVGIGLGLGALIFGSCAIAAFFTRSDKDMSFKQWLGVWGFAGTRNLRNTFQVRAARAVLCPAQALGAARALLIKFDRNLRAVDIQGCWGAGQPDKHRAADPHDHV